MTSPTESTSTKELDRRAMRINRKIRRANERWEPPRGWWLPRIPLLFALFIVLLGFTFTVLGVAGMFLDPTSNAAESTLGSYLRSHTLFVAAAAVVLTVLIFVRILAMRDKSSLSVSRLTTYVAALGIFDAACLAIARF